MLVEGKDWFPDADMQVSPWKNWNFETPDECKADVLPWKSLEGGPRTC